MVEYACYVLLGCCNIILIMEIVEVKSFCCYWLETLGQGIGIENFRYMCP